MPLFTDPLKEIDAASVKEYAQQRGAQELSDDIVNEACQRVMELAKPQASCQQCFYDNTSHMVLCDSPFTVNSQAARQLIEDSAIVLMYAVTLGEAVEQEIDKLFMDKEITRGLALDSAAAVATAGYTKQLVDTLDEASAEKGYKAVWAMSPERATGRPDRRPTSPRPSTPNRWEFRSCPAACSCPAKRLPA